MTAIVSLKDVNPLCSACIVCLCSDYLLQLNLCQRLQSPVLFVSIYSAALLCLLALTKPLCQRHLKQKMTAIVSLKDAISWAFSA